MSVRPRGTEANFQSAALLLITTLMLFTVVSTASAEVTSCAGVPVEGEVVGVVEEISAGEGGLATVFVSSDNQDLGLLTVTNGDPAQGANDLDQYADLFKTALAFESEILLNVANGQIIEVTLSKREGNVPCCKEGLCSKKKRATCTGAGGVVHATATACKKNCQ